MKIPFDNLVEVEDNPESEYISVTYNGEPFTGTAYCESHRGYEEHSYLNGLPHGRSFIINPEGILVYEDFSENGETIEDTSWYPTGIKRSYVRQTPFLQQRWNEKAVLILQKTDTHHAEWYASGRKKSDFVKGEEKIYYGEDGEWVVKIAAENGENYVVLYKTRITFNTPHIAAHYIKLLQDYDFYGYFLIWLEDLPQDQQSEIICNMIKSPILWLKQGAIGLTIKNRKVKQAIPLLKMELDNHEIPPPITSEYDNSTIRATRTIAESAAIALQHLQN